MFKKLIRLGPFVQFLVFLAFAFLLWIPAILHPYAILSHPSEGPLYVLFFSSLKSSPILSAVIAFLLLSCSAFLLNILLVQNDLHPRKSFLIAIFYLVMMSWNNSALCMTPVLPASLLLIFAVYSMQRMFGQTDAFSLTMTTSVLVAVASLMYYPAAYFILFVWLGLLTYRIASWREWVLSVIGFVLPYLYLATAYYLTDNLRGSAQLFLNSLYNYHWDFSQISTTHIVFYIFSGVLLLITSYNSLISVQDKVISIRRRSGIVNNFALACIPVMMVASADLQISHQFLFIPLAFYAGNQVATVKSKRSIFQYLLLLYFLFIMFIRFNNY
jgi:hypothetical protein